MNDLFGCDKLSHVAGCLANSSEIIKDLFTPRSPTELLYLDEDYTTNKRRKRKKRSKNKSGKVNEKSSPQKFFVVNDEEQQFLLNKTEMDEGETTRLPYFLSPFILPNLAISLSFFNIGLAEYLLSVPVIYYLIKVLSIDATHYSVFTTIVAFPNALRFIFGMIVDTLSFLGYRRKPWNLLGWLAYIILMIHLSTYSSPSLGVLTVGLFGSVCCYLFVNVCNDAQCIERANRFESHDVKGSIQSSVHGIKSFGNVLGSIISGLVFNSYSWGWGLAISELFLLSAIFPLTMFLPFWWYCAELKSCIPIPSVYSTLVTIVDTLALDAVRYPLIFVGIYSLMQIQNPSWTIFLVEGLEFNAFHLVLLTVCGSLGYFLGVIAFNRYFFSSNFRNIFIMTSIANFVFTVFQIILIQRWNQSFGVPDIVVAMIDYASEYFINGINSMPISLLFLMLCPDGSEGIVYSALLSLQQTAALASKDLGTALTLVFDVDSDSVADGDFTQVRNLTIITSILQLVPLFVVSYMPQSRAEINQSRISSKSDMISGLCIGVMYLTVIILTIWFNFSLLWS